MKTHSKERGCDGKQNFGEDYVSGANKMAKKHGKKYGVYRCVYCGGTHLTTKLENAGEYPALLYVTN